MEHNELLAYGPPVFMLTLAKRQFMDSKGKKMGNHDVPYFTMPSLFPTHKGEVGGG